MLRVWRPAQRRIRHQWRRLRHRDRHEFYAHGRWTESRVGAPTDAAGNVSADASLSFTLDTIAATPAIALGADSGLAGDGITKIGTVDVTGAMDEEPAVIKNIKTDFGAACNGIDSDYAAFQAFNTWALQWQQSHSGLIELDIPSGSICMFSQSGEGSWFAKGIKQLLVKGYGATLSDDNGAGGSFFLGGGGIESGNGDFGHTDLGLRELRRCPLAVTLLCFLIHREHRFSPSGRGRL